MKPAAPKTASGMAPPPPAGRAAARRQVFRPGLLFLLLLCALCLAPTVPAADPYVGVLEKHFAAPPENSAGDNPDPNAAAENAALTASVTDSSTVQLEAALKLATQKIARGDPPPPPPPAVSHRVILWTLTALLVGTILALPRIIDWLNTRYDIQVILPGIAGDALGQLRAEEEALTEFLKTFRTGPAPPEDGTAEPAPAAEADEAVKKFHAQAKESLAKLQSLLTEISAPTNEISRRTLLAEVYCEVRALKGAAGHSELLPVWQMAAALEGLVKQLINKTGNITPSTLRTVVGGIDLLKELCIPGLRPDLLTHPPIRLLAVDDDMISRKAVALALKKALQEPDLAEHGEAALLLARQHAYDAVFLDVQMPGMDGYELCSRLHTTTANQSTPVVFVTCQDDFASRAKSVEAGGLDLIGKPFLTFEITVKALTLIFHNRLQERLQKPAPVKQIEVSPFAAIRPAASRAPTLPPGFKKTPAIIPPFPMPLTPPPAEPTPALPPQPVDAAAQTALAEHIATNLATLQAMLTTLATVADEEAQTDQLMDFYLLVHSLTMNVTAAKLRGAAELGNAVETLIKKLLENSSHRTPSTFHTIAATLTLLAALNTGKLTGTPGGEPSLHLLVLDPDLTTRRVVVSALQTVFEKPESEEETAGALKLTQEKAFDVVFLALQMAGALGFPVAEKIHETETNRHTPVVFLASEDDFKKYAEAIRSEGMEVIQKPFLPVEINVKALTLALQHRCFPAAPAGPA